ncbi:MAG TPA: cupin domain-containing protein, partial [Mycobacteriales bacterium]|nr:cupin domain-containing protein [Mycobacteriales bacterium]
SFVSDGPPPHVLSDMPGVEITYVWATDEVVAMPQTGVESTRADQDFFPPPGGVRFLHITYPPGFGLDDPPEGVKTDFDDMAAHAEVGQLLVHATETVDYGVVLAGELCLVLPSGDEVALRAGDLVVQNGVVHGWRNRSDETATVVFVIVGARPAAAVKR